MDGIWPAEHPQKHLILSLKNYYFDIFLKAVELTRKRENM